MSAQERKDNGEDLLPGEGAEPLHGGEGDPLGGGVAELEDSDEVSEGVPEQDA